MKPTEKGKKVEMKAARNGVAERTVLVLKYLIARFLGRTGGKRGAQRNVAQRLHGKEKGGPRRSFHQSEREQRNKVRGFFQDKTVRGRRKIGKEAIQETYRNVLPRRERRTGELKGQGKSGLFKIRGPRNCHGIKDLEGST